MAAITSVSRKDCLRPIADGQRLEAGVLGSANFATQNNASASHVIRKHTVLLEHRTLEVQYTRCSDITQQKLSHRLRNPVFRTQAHYELSSPWGQLLFQHSQLDGHPCLANRSHAP